MSERLLAWTTGKMKTKPSPELEKDSKVIGLEGKQKLVLRKGRIEIQR